MAKGDDNANSALMRMGLNTPGLQSEQKPRGFGPFGNIGRGAMQQDPMSSGAAPMPQNGMIASMSGSQSMMPSIMNRMGAAGASGGSQGMPSMMPSPEILMQILGLAASGGGQNPNVGTLGGMQNGTLGGMRGPMMHQPGNAMMRKPEPAGMKMNAPMGIRTGNAVTKKPVQK